MKKITLFMAILFTSLTYSQVTIGTGNDGGVLESPPLTSYYGFSYGQSIYLSSEINANGNITSVAFQLIAGADMSKADNMVDVWIGHTTKTSFTSTSDWVDVASLTQVLTNGTVTIASDILTIMFSTPFAYNGTDNLIIAVDANESGYGSSGDRISVTDGPTTNLSIMYRSDGTNPDPTSPPNGIRFQSRGNITFNGITRTCPAPLTLTATNLTATSATLGWTAGAMETMWNVEYGANGFTLGSGTTVATTTNSHSLTGLIPETTYEFYVQANCGVGDLSTWAGPFAFTTPCVVITAPYTQNFDTFTVASSAFTNQNCWSGTNIGGYLWEVAATTDTSSANTGPGSGVSNGNYLFTESSSGATGDAIDLVFPTINLSNLTNPSLSFDYHMFGATMGNLEVIVSQGGTNTTVFTLTGQQQAAETDPFITKIIDLSSYVNQTVQITFKGIRGSGFTSDIAIDTIIIDELPACTFPSLGTATNIMQTSADLGWTIGATESMWNIEYGAAGFAQSSGTPVAATNNPFTLTGLTEATLYEFYVQANCGLAGLSSWAGPFAFKTACNTFTAPYTQDFENSGAEPICWSHDTGAENWLFANTAGSNHIGNEGAITLSTASGGYFAWVDSSGTEANAVLLSSLVDVSGLTTPSLTFYELSHKEDSAMNSQLLVEVYDGAAWNTVGTYNTNTSGWEFKIIDISNLTFTGLAQARFTFTELNSALFDDDIAIDDVTFGELPTCPPPSGLMVTNFSDVSADLSWTAGGTETMWNVEYGNAGFTQGMGTTVGATPPYSLTGLTINTNYEFYVQANCGAGSSSAWVGPFAFATNPANDDCANAIHITPSTTGSEVWISATTVGSTASGELTAADISCSSVINFGSGRDIWFTTVVPVTGNITITTQASVGSALADTIISVWSGTCGGLAGNEIECNDDGGAGSFSEAVLTGLTSGDILFIRVHLYNNSAPTDSDDGAFQIAAHSVDPTLSLKTNIIDGFSMFPNPVKDILKLNALENIQTISVFNLLGQEVMKVLPNTAKTELSMTHLQRGMYIVKVKVGDQLGIYKILKD